MGNGDPCARSSSPSRWDQVRRAGCKIEMAVENGLLILMVLVVFVQVGLRYLLNASLDWAEELARMAFVWLVFLGAMTALRRQVHLGVDLLVRVLPASVTCWIERVVRLCLVVTLALFVYYGTTLAVDGYIIRTPVLTIPWTYIYAAVPLSALGMLLQLVRRR